MRLKEDFRIIAQVNRDEEQTHVARTYLIVNPLHFSQNVLQVGWIILAQLWSVNQFRSVRNQSPREEVANGSCEIFALHKTHTRAVSRCITLSIWFTECARAHEHRITTEMTKNETVLYV